MVEPFNATQWLAETFRRNRDAFGGFSMEAVDPPADPPAATDPPADPPADPGKGGKDAILADLSKERDKRQAAETLLAEAQATQQAQLDAIAKALGLKSEDTPPDPTRLAEQITAEQAKASAAERRLAVMTAAPALGANGVALLDSASFLASLDSIDHSDAAAVRASIEEAVKRDERFKVAVSPPFPGGPRITAKPEPTPGAGRLRAAYADGAK